MFEFHNNVLCVEVSSLIQELDLSINTYRTWTQRKWLNVIRHGGNGRTALIEFDTIRNDIKDQLIQRVGDPYAKYKNSKFTDLLQNDLEAVKFFNNYTTASGDKLPQNRIAEYVANSVVFNAINELIAKRSCKQRIALGGRRNQLWENISKVVEELPRHTYPHSLPTNVRRLKDKFRQYRESGYESLIHKGYANSNSEKINENLQK